MNLLLKIISPLIVILIFLTSCSQSLEYKKTNSIEQCESKNGFWYNSRCWKEFEDEGISVSKIDSVVKSQIKVINKSVINIDGKTHQMEGLVPLEEGRFVILIAVFKDGSASRTLLIPFKKKKAKKKIFSCYAMLLNGDAISGEIDDDPIAVGKANVNIIDFDNVKVEIDGNMHYKDKKDFKFDLMANEAIVGAGNSSIEIVGDEAYLSGTLGTITYKQIRDLIDNHPNVRTIVMTKISGSLNDAVNMHTGRLIHENGFTTKVLSDSDIASGGVDLFCAGTKRIVEKGAKIGIHSWCCVNDMKANKLPKEHPAHKYQIEYFTMAMGKELGPDFYFHTLEAADFDDIHYMSDEEIKKWEVATEFVDKK